MWSKLKNRLTRNHLLLMVSGCAFILMTTPAWFAGMAAAAAMCLLWCGAVILVFEPETLTVIMPAGGGQLSGLEHFLAVAIVLVAGFACNFWNNWRDSGYFVRLAALAGLPGETLAFAGAVVAGLVSLPAVSLVLYWLWKRAAMDWRGSLSREDGCRISAPWAMVILTAVYILGISAVLKSNMYYQDDAGRGFYGYKQWDYFGRYLSTALATLVHGGDYLVDIAPFPQILAMGILAAASVLMLYILLDRTAFSVWELAAVVPVGLNPWFLECASFRFDAPNMAISVLLPILPLLWRNRSTVVYVFAAMLGTLGVCTSYQSTTGVFPMLVIALALQMYRKGASFRKVLEFCLKSVLGYGAGMLYFKLVIMKPAAAGYVSNALPEAGSLLQNTMDNLSAYFTLAVTDLKPWWLLLIVLITAGTAAAVLSGFRQKRAKAAVAAAAALVVMVLLSFGVYPVLQDTLFAPRAMYGLGILLAILAVFCGKGPKFLLRKLPVLILSWVFFLFALSYGNVLCLQREYTDFRMDLVLGDIQDAPAFQTGETVVVYVSGDIGTTPVLENMPREPGILRRLVPSTFAGGDDLTLYRFLGYRGIPNLDLGESLKGDIPEAAWDMPVLADTAYHTIRTQDQMILVELK